MNDILINFGISVSPAKLHPRRIEDVRKELKGDLLDTTLEDYASPTIDKKRIIGRGFQTDPHYLRDASLGSTNQHMFSFYAKGEDNPYVITVSDDGLVRFYNNINFKTYLNFQKEHILHRLVQIKDVHLPLSGFTINGLFEDEEQ